MRRSLPLALFAACVMATAQAAPVGQDPRRPLLSSIHPLNAPTSTAPTSTSTTSTAPTSTAAAADRPWWPAQPRPLAPRPVVAVRRVLIGRSRQQRPIVAYEVGDRRLPAVLVVGCIHGNETAGVPVTEWLVSHARSLPRVHLWLVPVLNPDGVARGTRQNAAGVDLNRNFPYRWAERNRGTSRDSGPAPLSEPESRAAARLILSARPAYGVWFHQALGLVDSSQGPPALEALFSRALRLPERPLTDYRGSAVGWQDQLRPRSAFVVELRAGQLSRSDLRSAALAVLAAARIAAGRSSR